MINKINRRVEEQREKMGDLSSPYSPHEQILGPDNEQVDGDNDFGQDFFDQQQSFHADNIKTQPLTSSKDRVFEREILDDTIESAIESTNAIAAGGMTWERLRGLLESDDPRCRRFALQKASRALVLLSLSLYIYRFAPSTTTSFFSFVFRFSFFSFRYYYYYVTKISIIVSLLIHT